MSRSIASIAKHAKTTRSGCVGWRLLPRDMPDTACSGCDHRPPGAGGGLRRTAVRPPGPETAQNQRLGWTVDPVGAADGHQQRGLVRLLRRLPLLVRVGPLL